MKFVYLTGQPIIPFVSLEANSYFTHANVWNRDRIKQ